MHSTSHLLKQSPWRIPQAPVATDDVILSSQSYVVFSCAARLVLTAGFACPGALLASHNKSPYMQLAAGSGAWKGLLDGFDGRV